MQLESRGRHHVQIFRQNKNGPAKAMAETLAAFLEELGYTVTITVVTFGLKVVLDIIHDPLAADDVLCYLWDAVPAEFKPTANKSRTWGCPRPRHMCTAGMIGGAMLFYNFSVAYHHLGKPALPARTALDDLLRIDCYGNVEVALACPLCLANCAKAPGDFPHVLQLLMLKFSPEHAAKLRAMPHLDPYLPSVLGDLDDLSISEEHAKILHLKAGGTKMYGVWVDEMQRADPPSPKRQRLSYE